MSLATSTAVGAGVIPEPIQSIQVNLPTSKTSFTGKVLLVLFWGVTTYLICQLLIIYAENQGIIKWWQQGTGPGKNYNQYFNIWTTLCQKQGSTLLYYIMLLCVPFETHMSAAQVDFVTSVLFRFLRFTDASVQRGIMIPRHLTESILLSYSDGDVPFQKWFDAHKTTRILTPDNPNDPSTAMKSIIPVSQITINGNTTAFIYKWAPPEYDPQKHTLSSGKIGIYPVYTDRESWKCCIQYWLNGENDVNWVWAASESAPGSAPMMVIQPKTSSITLNEWWDVDKHPDNIFARYGINYSSPLIIYFANGFFQDKNLKVPTDALKDLVNGNNGAGGWVGYLKGQGGSASLDDLKQVIDTDVNFKMGPPLAPCQGTPVTGSLLAAGGTFVTGMSALAFLGAETLGALVSGPMFPFVLGMSAISAGIAGYSSYTSAKKTCT